MIMDKEDLTRHIFDKGTYLCVGLDTDITRLPPHLLEASEDPVFAFNKAIIDATKDLCVAYKINTAFYESRGLAGWQSLERTVAYIPGTHFKIADAKRGDIGNTSDQYAKAFFKTWSFDAVTVAPYMGRDSVEPFLQYPGKWTILLGLTSNEGSRDFQLQNTGRDELLYEKVLREAKTWGHQDNQDNLMFVVGATRDDNMANIRRLVPEHFLLVPGVGFQGGNLRDISRLGLNDAGGLLVNASRSVIYADDGADFALASRKVAEQYRLEMTACLKERKEKQSVAKERKIVHP